jgi:hypothetical protein
MSPRAQRLAALVLACALAARAPLCLVLHAPHLAEVRVVTGRRGVSRCVELVRLAAEADCAVQRSRFRVSVRVVLEERLPWGLRAAAETSAAGVLASLLRVLDLRSGGVAVVGPEELEPRAAREAWRKARGGEAPLLLVLGGRVVLVGAGDEGLRRALATALAWAERA